MNRNPEVDLWFERLDNPFKDAMRRVREVILAADSRMQECVKWQAATFTYEGNLASFNPRSTKHVSLMFHTGAFIPGSHPRLFGGSSTARFMRFDSLADVEAQRGDLEKLVDAWIAMKSGAAKAVALSQPVAAHPAERKPAKKPAATKKAKKKAKKKAAPKKAKKKAAPKKAKKKAAPKKVKKKAAPKKAKKKAAPKKAKKKAAPKKAKKKAAAKKAKKRPATKKAAPKKAKKRAAAKKAKKKVAKKR